MVTVKQIFSAIRMLNPNEVMEGRTTEQYKERAYNKRRELLPLVEGNAVATSILESDQVFLTEKQMWVIAFELLKNETFCQELEAEINAERAEAKAKIEAGKAKQKANKEASQGVLDMIKEEGLLLKDYYTWLKDRREFKKEYYSKKYSTESAKAFIATKK